MHDAQLEHAAQEAGPPPTSERGQFLAMQRQRLVAAKAQIRREQLERFRDEADGPRPPSALPRPSIPALPTEAAAEASGGESAGAQARRRLAERLRREVVDPWRKK